ncbi:hypothetical protein QBC34DRAFT_287132 [Podospora aff. communis PSN243]|uniref:Transcription factor domain-containing protein n=1 Tax=Podospora aff. communis PSN243 TaxID=3040156 RepID=A0AAV9H8R4_9PEZI|nr:hypothetical protein QBC34DRAFT_287132 [Podospora aff. communis PSN243]
MDSCHRLNKMCQAQVPAPPRKRKEPKPGRIGELEKRILDLTKRVESVSRHAPSPPESEVATLPFTHPARRASLDQVSQGVTSPLSAVNPSTRERWPNPFGHIFLESDSEPSPQARPPIDFSCSFGRDLSRDETPSARPPTAITMHPGPPPSTQQKRQSQNQQEVRWPEGEEAETLLTTYKDNLAHLFPFAVVPPHLSSYELREKKPFFWKAIMMEAYLNDGARQIALGNELLRDISEAAILRPQKSLDLLQGLQVLISWYHYNLNSFQMTNLLYLARSMCVGLGFSELQGTKESNDHSSEYLERMRAFAGVYYLVTVIFTTNKKPDGLMGTTYLEECCRTLESRMEYPTDGILVWLVRAQQLSQSICLALAFHNAGVSVFIGQTEPLQSVIERFEQQIETFRHSIPAETRDNPSLKGHIHVAEILLYEIALQSVPQFNHSYTPSYRLHLLSRCLQATKAFLTNRFAREIGEYPRYICVSSFDFVYAFLTMLKLITVRGAPGWDLARARQELEFDKFLERQVRDMEYMVERRRNRRKFFFGNWEVGRGEHGDGLEGVVGEVSVVGEEGEEEDPFLKLAKKIRVLSRMMRDELQNDYAATQLTLAAETAPMTVTDAEGLMHNLEISLWGPADDDDPMGQSDQWELDGIFFSGPFS